MRGACSNLFNCVTCEITCLTVCHYVFNRVVCTDSLNCVMCVVTSLCYMCTCLIHCVMRLLACVIACFTA